MSRSIQALLSFLILIAAVLYSFYGTAPQLVPAEVPETEFSTRRAFKHVEAMAQQPHYVGSPAHSRVRNYIVAELQEMDLLVHTQEAYSLSKRGTLTRPQNIVARLEGSGGGKALLLMSHYDSAVHSSPGASDAASGVATILEGIRAYLATGAVPVNDIIIVFTDGEELGLNGAEAFVSDHPWASEVGLALNFEARGSGGKSFMLLETNSGNERLIEEFSKAGLRYPVTNSLAYSVYKMLPNDTDLTVLREQGDINGFNFAFIDDHFDYHTAKDSPQNLDLKTLAHQGSYLMPLLRYFAEQPLENFDTDDDVIYFSIPFMVQYPFSFSLPLLILSILLLIGVVIHGMLLKKLRLPEMIRGFMPLLIAVVGSGLLVFLFWQFCMWIYPHYREMEHGFTYNGYFYLGASISLALAVCFTVYGKFPKPDNVRQLYLAPLVLWILVSAGATFFLEGAAYFILLVFFGLIQLFLLVQQKKPNLIILALLGLPAIFIVQPFIATFPVALGLRILFISAVLTALLWAVLWPVFGFYKGNRILAFLSFLTFFALVIIAHFKADFTEERPKPNSLVYILDTDAGTATWNTYDELLDSWNESYFPEKAVELEADARFSSKYNSGFKKTVAAPVVDIHRPYVDVQQTGSAAGNASYLVKIAPNREMSRIELFAPQAVNFEHFEVNGLAGRPVTEKADAPHIFRNRWSDRLLTYYAANRDTLELNFTVQEGLLPEITMYEASHDLLENPDLNVQQRPAGMIPRPFVLNDAVVVKKRIALE